MTTGLKITDSIVTSLDSGKTANCVIGALGTDALGSDGNGGIRYEFRFQFYEDDTKSNIILGVFQSNRQIGTTAVVTLADDVEPITSTLLDALELDLETLYGWTITKITV